MKHPLTQMDFKFVILVIICNYSAFKVIELYGILDIL